MDEKNSHLTLDDLDDHDAMVDWNSTSFDWAVDFGEAGFHDVRIPTSTLAEQALVYIRLSSVTVSVEPVVDKLVEGMCLPALFIELMKHLGPDHLRTYLSNAEEDAA